MEAFKNLMSEVRNDIAIIREESQTGEEIIDVRNDINGFRDELATHKQKQDQINSKMTAPDVSKFEFQLLSRDIQSARQKSMEVDTLRTELSYLKTQFEYMERIQRRYSVGDDDFYGLHRVTKGLNEENFSQIMQSSNDFQHKETESIKSGSLGYGECCLAGSNLRIK